MNAPKLRFPGFEGEWVEKRLGEVAEFSKGKGISKSNISPNGLFECIRYGELYTHYTETINQIISRTDIQQHELIFSQANDVIIPASGETQIDIATASCVLRSGIALGGDLNIIRSSENGVFLSYYLNSKKKQDIANLAQGISVVHLYSSQLSLLLISLPTLPEQEKIAEFLSSVDNVIQLLTKKKTLLEDYKKGIMQKIFSQEIRFKDDDGNNFPEWEEKRLGEVAKLLYGKDQKSIAVANGIYPILGTGGIIGLTNEFLYNKPSVLIGRKGTIDKPFFMDKPFWTVDTLFYTEIVISTLPKWLFFKFQTVDWYLYNEASGIPSLSASTISKIQISLPSLPEQQKIADFLSGIDRSIEIVNSQIEKAKEYKKGLLQQMFV